MKIIIGILLLVFSNSFNRLYAQKETRDILYLKNGSIIRGIIKEQDAKQVKIESCNSFFVFPTEDIVNVSREIVKYGKQKGYLNMTELGVLMGKSEPLSNEQLAAFTIQSFHGYRIHPAFAFGLNTGLDVYREKALLPFALGFRGDFAGNKLSPYYQVDIGYAIPFLIPDRIVEADYSGGLLFQAGLGIKIHTGNQTAFLLSMAYRIQKTETIYPNSFWWLEGFNTEKIIYKRFALRAGFAF